MRYWYHLRGEEPDAHMAPLHAYVTIPLHSLVLDLVRLVDPTVADRFGALPQFAAAPVLFHFGEKDVTEMRYTLLPVPPQLPTGPNMTFSLRHDSAQLLMPTRVERRARPASRKAKARKP